MHHKSLQTLRSLAKQGAFLPGDPSPGGTPHTGHAHFWERALSRRQFLKTAAGAAGVLAGSSLWTPAFAGGGGADPKPIPGGYTGEEFGFPGITELFHWRDPSIGQEPSAITDFSGFLGAAHIQGYGTAKNTKTGDTTRQFFDADMRFMKGIYIGMDGRPHRGAFALI